MLWLAKQRWQQEVGKQVQAMQLLAAGSAMDDKPSRSADSREAARSERERAEKERQTETDDSSDSDSDSDSEQDNSQTGALEYIPPLPLSSAPSTGADELLPSVNPSFPFPASATSFSQFNAHMPQHSFTLPQTQPGYPLAGAHSFDTAAYDPDPPGSMPPSPAEQQICALYAVHTDYGLPAFADNGALLGYCIDQEAAGVVFYPLTAYDARQYPRAVEDGREVTEAYREAVRSGSGDVLWKKDWVDLDKLKEEAVLLLYTKNRGSAVEAGHAVQQPEPRQGEAVY